MATVELLRSVAQCVRRQPPQWRDEFTLAGGARHLFKALQRALDTLRDPKPSAAAVANANVAAAPAVAKLVRWSLVGRPLPLLLLRDARARALCRRSLLYAR